MPTHILTRCTEPSILAWERPHTTPGIYTFLGLATLPRFQTRANSLRVLPREIVDRIARFSHRDAYLASWSTGETPTTRPTELDISALIEASGLNSDAQMRSGVLTSRPIRSGVKYVEVTVSAAWYGTRLMLVDADGEEFVGIQVDTHLSHHANMPEDHPQMCFIRMNGNYLWIKSLGDDSWTWCNEPVVFGVLVDMVRGCVTFGINGIDGPCVRFSSVSLRGGVHIRVSHLPMDTSTPSEVVVSCATPPPPPSLLEAAATPLTGAEHVAAGSMEYDTDLFDWDDEDEDERDDEGESDDEDESDDD